jgi:hypothetical protein
MIKLHSECIRILRNGQPVRISVVSLPQGPNLNGFKIVINAGGQQYFFNVEDAYANYACMAMMVFHLSNYLKGVLQVQVELSRETSQFLSNNLDESMKTEWLPLADSILIGGFSDGTWLMDSMMIAPAAAAAESASEPTITSSSAPYVHRSRGRPRGIPKYRGTTNTDGHTYFAQIRNPNDRNNIVKVNFNKYEPLEQRPEDKDLFAGVAYAYAMWILYGEGSEKFIACLSSPYHLTREAYDTTLQQHPLIKTMTRQAIVRFRKEPKHVEHEAAAAPAAVATPAAAEEPAAAVRLRCPAKYKGIVKEPNYKYCAQIKNPNDSCNIVRVRFNKYQSLDRQADNDQLFSGVAYAYGMGLFFGENSEKFDSCFDQPYHLARDLYEETLQKHPIIKTLTEKAISRLRAAPKLTVQPAAPVVVVAAAPESDATIQPEAAAPAAYATSSAQGRRGSSIYKGVTNINYKSNYRCHAEIRHKTDSINCIRVFFSKQRFTAERDDNYELFAGVAYAHAMALLHGDSGVKFIKCFKAPYLLTRDLYEETLQKHPMIKTLTEVAISKLPTPAKIVQPAIAVQPAAAAAPVAAPSPKRLRAESPQPLLFSPPSPPPSPRSLPINVYMPSAPAP